MFGSTPDFVYIILETGASITILDGRLSESGEKEYTIHVLGQKNRGWHIGRSFQDKGSGNGSLHYNLPFPFGNLKIHLPYAGQKVILKANDGAISYPLKVARVYTSYQEAKTPQAWKMGDEICNINPIRLSEFTGLGEPEIYTKLITIYLKLSKQTRSDFLPLRAVIEVLERQHKMSGTILINDLINIELFLTNGKKHQEVLLYASPKLKYLLKNKLFWAKYFNSN